MFAGLLQQANKSTRGVGQPTTKALHTRPLQVGPPAPAMFETNPTLLSSFYFLTFAELCPKKRISVIIRITTALAGNTVRKKARRSCLNCNACFTWQLNTD